MSIFNEIHSNEKAIEQERRTIKSLNKVIHNRMIEYIKYHGILDAFVPEGSIIRKTRKTNSYYDATEAWISTLICVPYYERLDDLWSIKIYDTVTHSLCAVYPLTRSDAASLGESGFEMARWKPMNTLHCEEIVFEERKLNNAKEKRIKELEDELAEKEKELKNIKTAISTLQRSIAN